MELQSAWKQAECGARTWREGLVEKETMKRKKKEKVQRHVPECSTSSLRQAY